MNKNVIKKSRKLVFLLTAFVMFFTATGTVFAEQINDQSFKDVTDLENNTTLSDEELLNLDVSDMIDDKKVVNYVADTEKEITELEVKNTESFLEKTIDEKDIKIDDETFAYIDEINPEIDTSVIDQMDQEIDEQQSSEKVEGQWLGPAVRVLIAMSSSMFKKYGFKFIKVSYHLGLRMYQRGISPTNVFMAVKKGKKYYDPKYKSTVYYYKGVAVARKGNTLTTTYKSAKPKKRWR
ncbi:MULTISPECIES: hypothetical protein [Bacillus]|uniref:hypothetical protein n=1 Tax=Bacillus TaxID=1386 RepID=UPI0002C4DDAA|nr:hypothetical protein [Bacillus subtilis]WJD91859.1 DUF4258 domain-containing protein [Bacillus spizizenii]AGI30506.1 hypothetical protein I653_16330 [Bacillus subtilis subsp. subtilis str. BAB-1]AKD36568.1 hypothetical protein AW03_031960 [Bacillus subtilis HJ5]ALS80716.1 hypothetical protein AT706_01835 [Bacillus subtilis subsp. subtilis]ASK25380.1 hypothetical protein BSSX_3515 [Bacillus subtilis]